MGSKAHRREMRQAAAKARDNFFFQEGTRHPQTLRDLSGLSDQAFQAVQQRALADAQRPMSPHRTHAYTVLGAMATLMRDRVQDQSAPQRAPSVNAIRAATGKDPVPHGDLPVAEYAARRNEVICDGATSAEASV